MTLFRAQRARTEHCFSRPFALYAVVAVLLVTLLGVAALAQDAQRYVNKESHYSFPIPAGWKRSSNPMAANSIAFIGPKEQKFAVNLNVVQEPVGSLSLDKYIAATKQQVAKIKILKISAEKPTKLGGEPAYTWHMTVSQPGKPTVENRQVFCVHANTGFVLTFSALPSTIKKYEPTFNKILAGFKWEK